MTLITIQDGRVVLRDGKVGTEQACCCEVCNESVGETCAFFECESFHATEQDAQDYLDQWLADYEQFAAEVNIAQLYIDAGYSNVASSAEGFIFPADTVQCFAEDGLWSLQANWGFGGDCCGDKFIDYEAEPVLVNPNNYPPTSPQAGGGSCDWGQYYPEQTTDFYVTVIYPCVENPLP